MTLINEKLSARTATQTITDGYFHVILPSGAVYSSKKIKDVDLQKALNAKNTYELVFDDGDLSAGVLTVTHNKGTEHVNFIVKTPSNVIYNASVQMTIIDDNNVSIDFGGSIDAGNWNLLLIFYNQ